MQINLHISEKSCNFAAQNVTAGTDSVKKAVRNIDILKKAFVDEMKDEIVLYKPNEQFQLEVQLKDETVWLNVNQIALLFDRDRTVISRHIRNIYKEGELDENITCAKFAHMGMDADQVYETTYYNCVPLQSQKY